MKQESNDKVLKAGAGYVVGNYLLKGISFLSAPIFTRLLSKSEYGIVSTFGAYESLLYILIGLALHSSINSAKTKYRDDIGKFISSNIVLMLLSSGIWIIGANCFYGIYGERIGFSRLVINILVISAAASALKQVYNVFISLSYEYKSYLKISYFNAITNIALSTLLLLTVFKENRSLGRIIGMSFPMIAIGMYVVVTSFKKAKPRIVKEYWVYSLKYSLPIIPHGISQIILNMFDRIMIKDMVGAEEAGTYSFSYTVNNILNIAKTSLDNVWKPWVYEKMDNKDYDAIKKGASNYAVGMGGFTVLVMLISPEIIKVLGDKSYWDASVYVIPVIEGGFFAFLYSIPSIIEYYYEKTKFIAMATTGAAALNIILNYFFIPLYGGVAAAYTTLITYFLYFLFHYILARKIHGKAIFSSKMMFSVSLIVMICGTTVLFFERAWYIRWTIALLCGVGYLYWANKQFCVINKIKERLIKHE